MSKFKYVQPVGSKRARSHSFDKIATAMGTTVSTVVSESDAIITGESVATNVWSGTVETPTKGNIIVKLTATMATGEIVVDTFVIHVPTPTYSQLAGYSAGFSIQNG